MKQNKRIYVCKLIPVMGCLFLLNVVSGEAAPKVPAPIIEVIFVADGVKSRVEKIPVYLNQLWQGEQQSFPVNKSDKINSIINEVVDKQEMVAKARQMVANQLTLEDSEAVLAWLESSMGRALLKVEKDAALPNAEKEIKAFNAQVIQTPLTDSRKHVIQQLQKAMHIDDIATEILYQMMRLIDMSHQLIDKPLLDGVYKQDPYLKYKASLQEVLTRQTMESMYFTYNTVTDALLNQYLTFARSDVGKKYYEVVYKAIAAAAQLPVELLIQRNQ